MPDTARLLSDLRARRLARRLIELADELDAAGAIDPAAEEHAARVEEQRALERACEVLVARLERAVAHLDDDDPLRAPIETALRAHRERAPDRFRAALDAIGDAMRRSRPPRPRAR